MVERAYAMPNFQMGSVLTSVLTRVGHITRMDEAILWSQEHGAGTPLCDS